MANRILAEIDGTQLSGDGLISTKLGREWSVVAHIDHVHGEGPKMEKLRAIWAEHRSKEQSRQWLRSHFPHRSGGDRQSPPDGRDGVVVDHLFR